jgi:hypothetical protein
MLEMALGAYTAWAAGMLRLREGRRCWWGEKGCWKRKGLDLGEKDERDKKLKREGRQKKEKAKGGRQGKDARPP